jgi:hypothetical protein
MASTCLTFEVPDGWQLFDHRPDVLAVLRPVRDIGWFRTNVIAGRRRVPSGVSIDDVAHRCLEHLRSRHGEVEILGEVDVESRGQESFARVIVIDTIRPAARVAQLHAVLLGASPDDVTREIDLYELVGSCVLDELHHHQDAIAHVLAIARIVDAA